MVVVLSTMVENLFELIPKVYTRSTFPLSSNYRAMVKKEGNTSRKLRIQLDLCLHSINLSCSSFQLGSTVLPCHGSLKGSMDGPVNS